MLAARHDDDDKTLCPFPSTTNVTPGVLYIYIYIYSTPDVTLIVVGNGSTPSVTFIVDGNGHSVVYYEYIYKYKLKYNQT